MKKIAIVGGGIAGLAAAHSLEKLRRRGAAIDYFLYDSSQRLGGVICTERINDCIVEAGPDSFLTEKSWAADFCRDLGLGEQLICSNDASRTTYIVVRGRLHPIPDGLMFLVPTKIIPVALSSLFSWRTKLRMARELFSTPRASDQQEDESAASLVRRHYGEEMVERLADPMLSGVYGGDAESLSVRAVLPRFAEMERTHGSLGRAMLAAQKKRSKSAPPIFTSLKNGMQQLINALTARLTTSSLHTDMTVRAIERQQDGWLVSIGSEAQKFDAVILAVPAHVAAQLLSQSCRELSAELSAIRYTSSITVVLGYDREVRRSLPRGFGFLVPQSEGRRLLATTFVHNKFPHRAPDELALLRCFIAGGNAEALWEFSEARLLEIVRTELAEILGIRAAPQFSRVYRWKQAMAQYEVGHLDRMARIEKLCAELPGFALAGNAYSGIGIPDCLRSGMLGAKKVAA